MSKHTIWFKDGFNLKVDCIDDLRKNSGYLTMNVNIDKVRMQHPHCILKVNINCKGCEKKVRKLLLKIHVVDAVSIDAEQEKVTVVGKVDPNELIKQLKKYGKHAEICVQKGGENNGNGNGNGGKKNGNGNANANSGENNGNNANADGGKKNGNGSENNGNGNARGGKKNGNGSENNENGNASEGKKNENGNGNASGGKKNGNGNASGGENNGNGNMAQMVPIVGGGYNHQGMQMQPYSNEQLHHMNMMMMNQQQMNMYPQAINMYPSMNYMSPPPVPSGCMADHPTHMFSDENVRSCRIM